MLVVSCRAETAGRPRCRLGPAAFPTVPAPFAQNGTRDRCATQREWRSRRGRNTAGGAPILSDMVSGALLAALGMFVLHAVLFAARRLRRRRHQTPRRLLHQTPLRPHWVTPPRRCCLLRPVHPFLRRRSLPRRCRLLRPVPPLPRRRRHQTPRRLLHQTPRRPHWVTP